MQEETGGYFNDDGTPINPELISKPGLCITCKHDDDPDEEVLCMLCRMDQHGTGEFECAGYEKKAF